MPAVRQGWILVAAASALAGGSADDATAVTSAPMSFRAAADGASAALQASPPPVVPIIGGEPTAPGEFDGVVAIQAGNGLCSGTVVAPRLVLTAAHCLDQLDDNSTVIVHYGDEVDQGTVAAVSWDSHPRFCPDCKEDLYDFGYVEIASDFVVPGGYQVPIASQLEWDEAIHAGAEVILVGFGDDPGAEGDTIGIKRKVTTTIGKLTPAGLEFYAGGNLRDSCNGDSGGPAFARMGNGELRLAGITSRGSNPCGKGGYYGAPYAALCWLRDETGVDFVGGACANCDCIDTAPPDDDKGCSIASPPSTSWSAAMLVLFGVGFVGRTRRRRGALDSSASN